MSVYRVSNQIKSEKEYKTHAVGLRPQISVFEAGIGNDFVQAVCLTDGRNNCSVLASI